MLEMLLGFCSEMQMVDWLLVESISRVEALGTLRTFWLEREMVGRSADWKAVVLEEWLAFCLEVELAIWMVFSMAAVLGVQLD